jgi:hypothetical protein
VGLRYRGGDRAASRAVADDAADARSHDRTASDPHHGAGTDRAGDHRHNPADVAA